MSDAKNKHPNGAVLQYPDGSQYVYIQAAEDLSSGTFVEANVLGRLVKFKGEVKFPKGIVMETVPKEGWTFVMIKEPNPPVRRQEVPAIEMANVKSA